MVLDCILHTVIEMRDGVPLDGSAGLPKQYEPRVHPRHQLRQVEYNGEHLTLPYTAFADDIAVVTQSLEAAQRQLHAIQRLARKAGLEVNCKKGKTEFMTLNVAGPKEILSLDGEKIGHVEEYTYLGTTPFEVEKAFQQRLGKAWGAAKRLRHLWACPNLRSELKHRLAQSIVQSVLVYGAPLWPTTAEWRDRIDRSYTRLLKFCVGKQTELELYQHGAVPHLTSIITLLRVNTIGHALRHEQPLSLLLKTARSRKVHNLETFICRELATVGTPEDWNIAAHDRQEWRRFARTCAAENEDRIWRRLDAQRRYRWLSDARLQRRMACRYLEALAETPVFAKCTYRISHYQQLQSYCSPPRMNVYVDRGPASAPETLRSSNPASIRLQPRPAAGRRVKKRGKT